MGVIFVSNTSKITWNNNGYLFGKHKGIDLAFPGTLFNRIFNTIEFAFITKVLFFFNLLRSSVNYRLLKVDRSQNKHASEVKSM